MGIDCNNYSEEKKLLLLIAHERSEIRIAFVYQKSRYKPIDTAPVYGLDGRGDWNSSPERDETFLHLTQPSSGVCLASYPVDTGDKAAIA
jgi:hypothetical protein